MLVNMVTAINNALELILKENDNAVMLGEDVGKDGGVFRVTEGLVDKVRRGQSHGHAACGVGHTRCFDRHGAMPGCGRYLRYSSPASCTWDSTSS